jgi:hypothetical protein
MLIYRKSIGWRKRGQPSANERAMPYGDPIDRAVELDENQHSGAGCGLGERRRVVLYFYPKADAPGY